jgi:voltage-gated potassium channel
MSKYPSIKDRTFSNHKEKWHNIIFGADTIEGRRFDIWLLWIILFSILILMIDSIGDIHDKYRSVLKYLEYGFTAIFSLEYLARLYVSDNKKKYVFSFYGIVDLISTLPTYLSFFFPGSQVFRVLRTVRLLRIFKVLRLTSFMGEAQGMAQALKRSGAKITVFFGVVLVVVVVMGTVMFVIEGPQTDSKFTSIPKSIYWAIVTLTTVGYGDMYPTTGLGQFLSSMLMILGYAVIAVPTGIVSVEMSQTKEGVVCSKCDEFEKDESSNYCRKCGAKLK